MCWAYSHLYAGNRYIIDSQSATGRCPKYTILVFAKLHLTPTGDAEVAEQLLKEKLLAAAKGIEGLKITALKRMQLPGPGAPANTNQPDFVMMAELT